MGLNSLLVLILFKMKLYIEDYKFSNLVKRLSSLKKYLVDTKTRLEISSNDGEYYIDNSRVYKIIISDEAPKRYEKYYKNLNLIVDSSYTTIIETNQIPNNNIEFVFKYLYFALNKSSKLKLVIKTLNETVDDINNIIPVDFYFEKEGNDEINTIFFKDEINVFLSLLN